MKPALRQVLAESHVALFAIAALFWVAISWAWDASAEVFARAILFLATAVAVRGLPSSSSVFGFPSRYALFVTCFTLLSIVCNLAAAALLSQWIYKADPLIVLRKHHARFSRRNDV